MLVYIHLCVPKTVTSTTHKSEYLHIEQSVLGKVPKRNLNCRFVILRELSKVLLEILSTASTYLHFQTEWSKVDKLGIEENDMNNVLAVGLPHIFLLAFLFAEHSKKVNLRSFRKKNGFITHYGEAGCIISSNKMVIWSPMVKRVAGSDSFCTNICMDNTQCVWQQSTVKLYIGWTRLTGSYCGCFLWGNSSLVVQSYYIPRIAYM